MINILFIESGTSGGGSFQSLYLHLKYIDRKIYNPIVVLLNKTKFDTMFNDIGVEINHIEDPIYSSDINSLFVRLLRKVYSKSQKFNITLLKYFFKICHYPTIKAIKKIIYNHNIAIMHLNDQILRDLFCVFIAEENNLSCISHLRSMRSRSFTKQIANYVNDNVNLFIANSNMTLIHWANLGLDKGKIKVIYNAIETKRKDYTDYEQKFTDLKQIKLGCIANFMDAKGHDFLIRTFYELSKISNGFILFLAGRGPLESKIKRLVKDLNIESKVIFLGYVDDPFSTLKFIDILLVPSKSEAFGRIILEGMISNTPVIATQVGGIPEIIQNKYNGILVKYNDIYGFAEAILELSNKTGIRNNIIHNAKVTVYNKFSVENYLAILNDIYKSVI